MPPRFVIHLHQTRSGCHYDLMLEAAGALATWRLERLPAGRGDQHAVPAGRLPDHRLAYLTYQGPISRGRGTVRRIDRGTYRLLARSAGRWTIRLAGRRIKGVYRLRRLRQGRWALLALPARRAPGAASPPQA